MQSFISFNLLLVFLGLFSSRVFSIPHLLSRAASNETSKRIIYYQDVNTPTNQSSLLPLINSTSNGKPIVSTVIVSTFFVFDGDFGIPNENNTDHYSLNNTRFDPIWSDVAQLQRHDIKVAPMLLGNWIALKQNQSYFDSNYKYIHDALKQHNFDGIDLDIEDNDGTNPDPFTLNQTIRLIDRLRKDFGPAFQITMSPVASCLASSCGGSCLSGFSYKELEKQRGNDISWYNTQFYDGHGSAENPACYEAIVKNGWKPEKVVMALSTNEANTRHSGGGYVDIDTLHGTIGNLTKEYSTFGGVAGWVYYDAEPGGWPAPWKWSEIMASFMGKTNGTSFAHR